MHKEVNVNNKDIRNCKLLALFNNLEEMDKDIVIKMSEFLVEKWEKNTVIDKRVFLPPLAEKITYPLDMKI